ncbi:8244_t:CDS:2 [Funneliformis geosporum]|uniref:COP9 signalosome complex subunit 8 n=1 Tax=Funneliformis geosporum TaxID=1117311 RepID=A0A9W4SGY7_9GLOM|nr:8244_t:CDS:2 [Funneliformis geosporum]CAI2168554.1 17675_t:CDS:2 [Funneliformis geosporum]
MDTIKEHIESRDYAALVDFCEDLELQLALTPNVNITPEDFYGPFLLGYLLEQDLPSARFLWKRLPDAVKSTSKELRAIWDVGSALWQRDYENIYELISSKTWSPIITPLMEQLADNLRERMLNLISEAYSSIVIDDVVKYLGFPREKVLTIVEERGWEADLTTNMLQPKKIKVQQSTSLANFSQLTDLVIHLEKS